MIRGNMTIQAISPKDLLIYLCLRRYRNTNTGESSVSIAKIAELTRASPVTILTSIERLKTSKHIECAKRGRQNFYSFLTDIEAPSYDFFDEDLSHADKVDRALKSAYVPNDNDSPEQNEKRLYTYVASLETTITMLKKHLETLTVELNQINKSMSAITGIPYKTIEMP